MSLLRWLRPLAVLVLAGLGVTMCTGTATAAPGPVFGVFSLVDGGGTMELAPGFPDTTFVTNSAGPSVPSGASAYLNVNTPVGAVYGFSLSRGYLNLQGATSSTTSTTTYTFASGTPSGGWSFVLGDVDADSVTITATTPENTAVAIADLGFQGAFNYCLTPVPGSCSGTTPGTDVPGWNSATGVLTGNGPDTTGASAWFSPSVPLGTLTFLFTEQSGSPIYQTWFVTQTRSVTGAVTGPSGTVGAVIDILDDGGAVVATTTTLADGGYLVDGLAPGSYTVRVTPPDGYIAVGDTELVADLGDGDQTDVDFEIALEPPPTTGTETTSQTTTATATETTTETTSATATTSETSTAQETSTTATSPSTVTTVTTTVSSYFGDDGDYYYYDDDPADSSADEPLGYGYSGGGTLAATGAHTAPLLAAGLGFTAAGGLLVWGSGRRTRGAHRPSAGRGAYRS